MSDRHTWLTYAYLRDLISDIRCARRDGMDSYEAACVEEFRQLWPRRHGGVSLDRYGAPITTGDTP